MHLPRKKLEFKKGSGNEIIIPVPVSAARQVPEKRAVDHHLITVSDRDT